MPPSEHLGHACRPCSPLPGFLDRLGFSFLQQHRGARKTSTVGTVEGRASSIPLAPAIIPQDEESALEER